MKRIMMVVTIILALVLLVGCGVPQADYDKVVAERDQALADYNTQNGLYAALQGDYNTLQEDYDAVKEEKNALLMENANLLAKVGPIIDVGDFQTKTVNSEELDRFLRKLFPKGLVAFLPGDLLNSLDPVEEFLSQDTTTPNTGGFGGIGFTMSYSGDELAFRMRQIWKNSGLPLTSFGFLKKEEINQRGERFVCWRVIFVIKETSGLAAYELNFANDELVKIQQPMNTYSCVLGAFPVELE